MIFQTWLFLLIGVTEILNTLFSLLLKLGYYDQFEQKILIYAKCLCALIFCLAFTSASIVVESRFSRNGFFPTPSLDTKRWWFNRGPNTLLLSDNVWPPFSLSSIERRADPLASAILFNQAAKGTSSRTSFTTPSFFVVSWGCSSHSTRGFLTTASLISMRYDS